MTSRANNLGNLQAEPGPFPINAFFARPHMSLAALASWLNTRGRKSSHGIDQGESEFITSITSPMTFSYAHFFCPKQGDRNKKTVAPSFVEVYYPKFGSFGTFPACTVLAPYTQRYIKVLSFHHHLSKLLVTYIHVYVT